MKELMKELIVTLGFEGQLAAHALASAVLFALTMGLVKRQRRRGRRAPPQAAQLTISALLVVTLNLLIAIARNEPVTLALISSCIVGAFLAMCLHSMFTKGP